MARLGMLFGPLVLVLWVFCVVDVIMSKDDEVRHLPKIGWLILVLLFPLVGSVAWLVAGRPRRSSARSRFEREAPSFPEYDRPGRAAGISSESDEEFLRRCRERAEEQRRRHAEEQRRKAAEEQKDTPEADPAAE